MKKYISAILINAILIQLAGCYSMQEVTKEEFSPKPDYPNLKILTEEREFTFKAGLYSFKNDTIFGSGETLLLNDDYQPFEGKICVNDIENFKTDLLNNLSDTINVTARTKEKEFVFKYKKDSFYIKNDSIYCKGKYRLVNNVPEPFYGRVDLNDVKEIQMEEFNVVETIALTAGVLVVVACFVALSVASSFSIDFSDK